MVGRIFDIKEMTVHDGSGIRVTVFLKGCPLKCQWCHNPEGMLYKKQLIYKSGKCIHCGLCLKGCEHNDCKEFSRCLQVCPNNCLSVVGEDIESEQLVMRLKKYKPIFDMVGGGITFSGGEPLMQWKFLLEVIKGLKRENINDLAIETSGYASEEVFQNVVNLLSEVIIDIKLFDPLLHLKYTGVSNELIKKNYLWLKKNGYKHIVRTPLIEGKTDTKENLLQIGEFVKGSRWEQLPENKMAKAKLNMLKLDKEYGVLNEKIISIDHR